MQSSRQRQAVVDFTGDEETIANGIRQLVSILPANNETEAFADCEDDLNRVCADMAAEIADPALALSIFQMTISLLS